MTGRHVGEPWGPEPWKRGFITWLALTALWGLGLVALTIWMIIWIIHLAT